MEQFLISKVSETAQLPTRANDTDAGYDLYAVEDAVIEPGATVVVATGLVIALPDNMFGAIFARSGLATNKGLRPANCVAVCDPGYRGEYKIPLHNDSNEIQYVTSGDRIAQLVVLPYVAGNFTEISLSDMPESMRGEGGFGSTGA